MIGAIRMFVGGFAGLILALLAAAQDAVPVRELDRRADQALYDAMTVGVTLYNSGNPEACYELYRGTALATARFLEHRGDVAANLKQALAEAAAAPRAMDKANAMRGSFDRVRAALGASSIGRRAALWDRLGGETAVRAVVHDFVAAAAPDPTLKKYSVPQKEIDELVAIVGSTRKDVVGQ